MLPPTPFHILWSSPAGMKALKIHRVFIIIIFSIFLKKRSEPDGGGWGWLKTLHFQPLNYIETRESRARDVSWRLFFLFIFLKVSHQIIFQCNGLFRWKVFVPGQTLLFSSCSAFTSPVNICAFPVNCHLSGFFSIPSIFYNEGRSSPFKFCQQLSLYTRLQILRIIYLIKDYSISMHRNVYLK